MSIDPIEFTEIKLNQQPKAGELLRDIILSIPPPPVMEFSDSAIETIAKMFSVPAHLVAPINSNYRGRTPGQ